MGADVIKIGQGWGVWGFFGAAVLISGGVAIHFILKAYFAKKNVRLLVRVGEADPRGGPWDMGARSDRLAHTPGMQALLRSLPGTEALANLLEPSGLSWSVAQLVGGMLAWGGAITLLGLVWGLHLASALFVAGIAMGLPLGYVVRARGRRAAAFEAQLPHVLELMGLYLRSGRSLPQALVATTQELTLPASEEFGLCIEAYRLGRPLDSALQRLAHRYPASLGLRLFAIAVSVLGQTGGNLVEVLERIKKTLDASVTYSLRLRSVTGDSRMSAWILGATPGFFMAAIAVLNATYFNQFFITPLGLMLLGSFVIFWMSGILWIRFLMRASLG